MSDQDRIERTFTDAIFKIADLFGHDEIGINPSVDLDTLPAPVVACARSVMDYLTVGLGILDPEGPAVDLSADEFLARLTTTKHGGTP